MTKAKDHCVLSRTASNRTWGNEADAIEHAKRLLTKDGKESGRLFVVKIVKVVELTPPPTTVRDLAASDLEE